MAITGINAEGHQKKTGDAARRHLEVKYNFSSNYSCLSEFEIQGQDFPAKGVNKSSANNVKGSLRNSISYWERIGANSGVMDLIEHGYKIPFLNNPPDGFFENNKSALKNRDFVEKEVNNLLATGRILEVKQKPLVVNPLTVSENGGKKRLILDLSHVNFHVYKNPVKMDDWKAMLNFVEKGDFFFKFDITQGYHHIDIWPEHQQFLGFAWEINGVLRYFIFTVLPFGLTSGPLVFTKVMRPLIKYWRGNGITIACYLDDGLGCGKSYANTNISSSFVRDSLLSAGFIVNEEKSVWEPTRQIVWLGIKFNSENGCFSITDARVDSLNDNLEQFIQDYPYTTPRKVARLCGKLVSTKFVLGNIVQLKTRHLHHLIKEGKCWDSRLVVSRNPKVIKEVCFWKDNFPRYNCRYIYTQYSAPIRGYSDASNTGIAAHIAIEGSVKIACKNLTALQRIQSSTWREIFAIHYAILSFKTFLAGKNLVWSTDNYAASCIIDKGSNKLQIQELCENIFNVCKNQGIKLSVKWVPREFVSFADKLSREVDYDDWETTSNFFEHINSMWGPFTIDRFANEKNAKTSRFNSKFHCPVTEGVNAFHYSWAGENNYLVPPVYLVPRVLRHMKYYKAKGVLVVPYWKSAIFYPMIITPTGEFQNFIKGSLYFDDWRSCIKQGTNEKCFIGSENFKSGILALNVNF